MILVHKPPGPTSHDIVNIIRKQTGERRVGHTGTLDPFAEGLLIVLVGREETKRQAEFLKLDKEYVATLHLGAETETGDRTGKPLLQTARGVPGTPRAVPASVMEKVLKKRIGKQIQVPPSYSAIKIGGKKAYELARRGTPVNLEPRPITIYELEMLNYAWPLLIIRTRVSSGTYIRALARDIGRALGTGAYLEELVRTKIGEYKLEDAEHIDDLRKIP